MSAFGGRAYPRPTVPLPKGARQRDSLLNGLKRHLLFQHTLSQQSRCLAGFRRPNYAVGDARSGRSGVHVAAIDGDGLTGDEVAVRGGEEDQRADEVLRMLVA